MRLLQAGAHGELTLTKDVTTPPGPYAILSHTWGADDEEVTFNDLEDKTGADKIGYAKLRFCANQARKDGLEYFWVDTCCINKQSSAELSEAINSMYNWYQGAKLCYVYFNDVEKSKWKKSISKSRWFKRGWTLQEQSRSSWKNFCYHSYSYNSTYIKESSGVFRCSENVLGC
jgi:hypothetical protein